MLPNKLSLYQIDVSNIYPKSFSTVFCIIVDQKAKFPPECYNVSSKCVSLTANLGSKTLVCLWKEPIGLDCGFKANSQHVGLGPEGGVSF